MAPREVPVIDGFSDLRSIGRGGFSIVYSATQAGIERRVAIKVLDLGDTDHHRFERECRTLGSLSGVRGIVPVLQAAYTSTGQPCIVMQLMDGGSLANQLHDTGPLSVADVVTNGVVIADALQRAHMTKVFHRDIKPENVLFHDGEAAVADFGIALVEDLESRSQTIESISPPHAPPERFLDSTSDPVLGDVYSLGSTLYAALAGRPPFGTAAEGGMAGLIDRVTRQPLPAIERSDVSPALGRVLNIATAKDPTQRYPSMADFAAALRAAGTSADDDGSTVLRRPRDSTVLRTPQPAIPPTPSISTIPPFVTADAGAPQPIGQSSGGTGPHWQTQPPPPPQRTSRGLIALWVTAAVLGVASLAGVAFLLGRDADKVETAEPTTTSSTTTTTTTTTSQPAPVVLPAESTTTEAAPAVPPPPRTRPTTTTTTTQPPYIPVAEAATAIDRFLAANTTFDVEGLVASWTYPAPKYYRHENATEDFVRQKATEMFARYSFIDFRRVSEPTVRRSGDGWEATFDYRAEMVPLEGEPKCVINQLTLGFTGDWLIRTAAERDGTTC